MRTSKIATSVFQSQYTIGKLNVSKMMIQARDTNERRRKGINITKRSGQLNNFQPQIPSSITWPHREHLILRSSRQRPMPRGNQNTATNMPERDKSDPIV